MNTRKITQEHWQRGKDKYGRAKEETERERNRKSNETGHNDTVDPHRSLSFSLSLSGIWQRSQNSSPGLSWDDLWECAVIPPVELIYVEFYLPPHLAITGVIITTLYMPVHSARRHIHQTPVTGNSFINDQIHFCGITALWCMGRCADARQTDTHAGRLILQQAIRVILCCVVVMSLWACSIFRTQMWNQTGSGTTCTFIFILKYLTC